MSRSRDPRASGPPSRAGRPAEIRSAVSGAAELLLHADLHNHTRLSDGAGRPEDAFASMRGAGLDVAAVTDHTYGICAPSKTIDESGWRQLGRIAGHADEPGCFVAMRGFEWSSPSLGHMNVWGSQGWVEPLPLEADGVPTHLAIDDPGPPQHPRAVSEFYDWLTSDPAAATPHGAAPLIGFNHPGRERHRFGLFHLDHRLVENVVAFEMFNRDEDYLFQGIDHGLSSPLVECLDAGWRPGLIGVTDEHGDRWGHPTDLGRTGIWATERSRAGVREAMLGRRMFATRERDLRVDATADGIAMGGHLAPRGDRIELTVSIDGPGLHGRALQLQCLCSGRPLPETVLEVDFTADGRILAVDIPMAELVGSWLVLRVTDPARLADPRAQWHPGYVAAGRAVAYLSPFYIDRGNTVP